MRPLVSISRVSVLITLALAGPLPDMLPAEKPGGLPYQRLLQGDEARRAADLEKQVDERERAGKFAEALAPVEELLKLRRNVQGDRHWQTVDARFEYELVKRLAGQPA